MLLFSIKIAMYWHGLRRPASGPPVVRQKRSLSVFESINTIAAFASRATNSRWKDDAELKRSTHLTYSANAADLEQQRSIRAQLPTRLNDQHNGRLTRDQASETIGKTLKNGDIYLRIHRIPGATEEGCRAGVEASIAWTFNNSRLYTQCYSPERSTRDRIASQLHQKGHSGSHARSADLVDASITIIIGRHNKAARPK